MILGSRTVGPFDFEPHAADRLKLYAVSKNLSFGEVVKDAVRAFIDADTEEAKRIDAELSRRYNGAIPPERKTKRDLRDEAVISVMCEDHYDPGYRAEHGLPPLESPAKAPTGRQEPFGGTDVPTETSGMPDRP